MPNGDIMAFHIASIKILSIVQVKLKVKMIGKSLQREVHRNISQFVLNWIPFSVKYIFEAADTILPSVYLQEKDGLNRRNRWKCIAK